ncbi:MAG: 3-hydroxyacyl-CoA dehydrogenase [Desulfomonilaceae bacterium]
MKLSEIKRVLILGSGTMGRQIGFVCALHGYKVVLFDLSVEILDDAKRRIESMGSWFVSTGRIKDEELSNAMANIELSSDPKKAAADTDFISESLPEDPNIKAETFAMFNKLCPPRTIFTTNTSTLVPSMFADRTGRPEKFAALHFHDVRTSNIVDVMPHQGTAPEVVELVCGFAESLGQVVILLNRENSGYVFNTMLSALLNSALALVANGVATIEDVDRSWMGVMGKRIGPFGIMDQIGLSTVWMITEYHANQTSDPQTRTNATFVKQYVDKGALGFKTMRGFYSYPNPEYSAPHFIAGQKQKGK